MYIEEALEATNDHGIMQAFSIVLLSLYAVMNGMQIAVSNYVSGRFDHWCAIPELENLDYETQKKLAIPYDGEDYDSCRAYNLHWENFTLGDLVGWNGSHTDPSTPSSSCHEWTYYKGDMDATAVSEWNLVCNNETMPELLSTLFMLGMLVGSFVASLVSERLGRSLSTLVFSIMLSAVTFASAFTPEPISFAVLRFLMGLTGRAAAIAVTVHVLEIAGKGQRELAGVLSPAAVALGTLLTAFCGYFLRDFQMIILVMAVCQTVLLVQFFIVPESPRWLIVSGRQEKAERIVRWIGTVNQSPLPENAILEVKKTGAAKTTKKDNLSYGDLFRNPVLRKNMLLMHYFIVAGHFSYMTMTLNLGSLTGSVHTNVFLSGILELPATIAAFIILKFLDRVMTLRLFGVIFTLCNVIAIIFELVPDLSIVATVFTILARAAASAQICAQRIMVSELFPTAVRQRVIGSITALSSILSLAGPFIGEPLRNVWAPLPNILFGTLGLFAVFFTFILPETRGISLPDTIEEAAQLSKRLQREKAKNAQTVSEEKQPEKSNEQLKNYANANDAYIVNEDVSQNTKF